MQCLHTNVVLSRLNVTGTPNQHGIAKPLVVTYRTITLTMSSYWFQMSFRLQHRFALYKYLCKPPTIYCRLGPRTTKTCFQSLYFIYSLWCVLIRKVVYFGNYKPNKSFKRVSIIVKSYVTYVSYKLLINCVLLFVSDN